MNPWALIATFFALTTTLLFYAWRAQCAENKQLRYQVNRLWRANIATESHLTAASELWQYCREVEARSEYLESTFVQFKNSLAGAKLKARSGLDTTERLAIRQGSESP